MLPLKERVTISIEGREVLLGAWLYVVTSETGGKLPVIFLDSDLPENDPRDREITHSLYGGDLGYRLKQEIALGIGGCRMLDALGFEIKKYHMNEGQLELSYTGAAEEIQARHRGGLGRAACVGHGKGAKSLRLHHPYPRGCRA
ncbi:MAG: hypothetical protein MZW92_06430 [Comamonadaceae bacterium]|nr:hypothetical protein [Comamonadaceae bacterium]